MITSKKQYHAAKEKVSMLKESLKKEVLSNIPFVLIEASQGQTKELMNDIEKEIKEYESLKKAELHKLKIHSIDDLMSVPIRYRIARDMTIEQFAKKVEVHSRQIARYEKETYKNVNSATLLRILSHLDVSIEGEVSL